MCASRREADTHTQLQGGCIVPCTHQHSTAPTPAAQSLGVMLGIRLQLGQPHRALQPPQPDQAAKMLPSNRKKLFFFY